jgi:hypothetical protein
MDGVPRKMLEVLGYLQQVEDEVDVPGMGVTR